MFRVSGYKLVINESNLVKRAEINSRCHYFLVWALIGLQYVLYDDRVAVGENNLVGVEPFEVLYWLLLILEKKLRHVDFFDVPHL